MRHRDRVLTALSHGIPDRCPMQISYTPEFAARLEKEMNLGDGAYQLERALDQDMLRTTVGWATSYHQDAVEYVDEWGVGWRSVEYATPYGVGRYTDFSHHPLAQDQAIDHYQPPDPHPGCGASSSSRVWPT